MNEQCDISIVICTYNRAAMLARSLDSVLRQDAGAVRYEVIVVDNNSTDATRTVVEDFIKRGASKLRYLFEGEQGKSYALNTGIRQAHAPVLAFTDDDVRAAPDWVRQIKRGFDRYPEAAFVGGKVLPRWGREPPAWLTNKHWAPLALTVFGDAAFHVDNRNPHCLVGANLAVRREVFERVGGFATHVNRVGDDFGTGEDHEFEIRVWRAGGAGVYVPELVVHADVQDERLTKNYHRRWYAGHGRSMAKLRLRELIAADGSLLHETPESTRLFGTPAHVYRSVLVHLLGWVKASLREDESRTFWHEAEVRDLLAYIGHSRELDAERHRRNSMINVLTFAKEIARKKLHSYGVLGAGAVATNKDEASGK